MSGYRLRLHGDPVLRERAEGVVDDLTELVPAMKRILAAEKGVGIAAQQVGSTSRVALCCFDGKTEPTVCINLRIIAWSKARALNHGEGCLSWYVKPGLLGRASVRRNKRVTIQYEDECGRRYTRGLTGLNAIIAQHEADHLDGRCIADGAA